RLCLHGRLRGGVRGGNPRPRLSPVVCAEHLQCRPDVRADSSDSCGGAADLWCCGSIGKISAALELTLLSVTRCVMSHRAADRLACPKPGRSLQSASASRRTLRPGAT